MHHYRQFTLISALSLALVVIALLLLCYSPVERFEPWYIFLGTLGAIFANSTGAGGGVIFIPTFNLLGLSDSVAIASSFGIQNYGMTAGALSWAAYHYTHLRRTASGNRARTKDWHAFVVLSFGCSVLSIAGIWNSIAFNIESPASLKQTFSAFSLVLGCCIIYLAARKQKEIHNKLTKADYLSLAIISYFGGMITAWLSIGVGELIAFYLLLRACSAALSVGVAVVTTAATIWSVATITFDAASSPIYWDIVLLAGPGAIIGGVLARMLVSRLPERGFKLFFGAWLIIMGLSNN